jgi:hypothetical protein
MPIKHGDSEATVSTSRVHPMQREHVLCQVNAHGSNLFHDFPSGYLD